MGDEASTPRSTSEPTIAQRQTPPAYIPPYLAEKILIAKTALEGERKQVTVLFADLKGSMELSPTATPRRRARFSTPCSNA